MVECLLEQSKATTTQLFQYQVASSKQRKDALSKAVESGDLRITVTLLEKMSHPQKAIDNAWISASEAGQFEIVQHLLKKTGDPGEDVKSRAFNAAAAGNHGNVMLFLVECGLKIGPHFRRTLDHTISDGRREAV